MEQVDLTLIPIRSSGMLSSRLFNPRHPAPNRHALSTSGHATRYAAARAPQLCSCPADNGRMQPVRPAAWEREAAAT